MRGTVAKELRRLARVASKNMPEKKLHVINSGIKFVFVAEDKPPRMINWQVLGYGKDSTRGIYRLMKRRYKALGIQLEYS